MDYNLLTVFSKVAELGSFTKAAALLNQPKSRVSRAITRLESELGAQLLRRTTRKTSLTNAGLNFHKAVAPLLKSLNTEISKVSSKHQEMSGSIKITASQDIGQTLVTQLITEFSARFPEVLFEIVITNEYLDLTKLDIDIAFRAGKLQDSTLKQSKILDARFILVCSKSYFERYGGIGKLDDLHMHRFLSFRNMEKNFFNGDSSLSPNVVSDSIPMLINMTLKGSGIAMLPDFFCKDNLNSKALVHILPGWHSEPEGIHMLYSPSSDIPKKVRAFIDFAKTVRV